MASISTPKSNNPAIAYSAAGIAKIVGLACLAGFSIDMAVLILPPELGSVEWRSGIMQQFADRSIILLIGAALTLFGSLDSRRWLKNLSLLSLLTGVLFFFMSLLVVADSISLQRKAISTIGTQSAQVQSRIEQAQANPSALGANVTPENLAQAEIQLKAQTTALTSNAKKSVLKLGVSSVSNLVIVGLGLISLGRYGARLRGR
jgi:hypothetical protein